MRTADSQTELMPAAPDHPAAACVVYGASVLGEAPQPSPNQGLWTAPLTMLRSL